MNLIYTVLFGFAIGYFIKNRGFAILTYLAIEALLFTYQTLTLVLEWVAGSTEAFGGPFPDNDATDIVGYGIVNLAITAAGVALVILGARTGRKRAARKDVVAID